MSFQFKVGVFMVASVGIVWVSWPSLRNFRFHGFYRFFAWEAILVLILINFDYWFYAPLSALQVISWFLLIVSLFLVIHGVQLLRMVGKPDDQRADPSLIGIEKTTTLVTVGAFKYIRHPLYSSLLFLVWGAFFKHTSWIGVCLAVLTTFFLTLTAKVEEAENIGFFGDVYRSYLTQTKMFVPFLF